MRNKLISHEDYKKCLFNETDMSHVQTRIGQKDHQLITIKTKKTSLSPFNDKRYKIFNNKTNTNVSLGGYQRMKKGNFNITALDTMH